MKKVARRQKSGKRRRRSQPKPVYRIKNWAAYNQALQHRGSLTIWFSTAAIKQWRYQGPTQRGAQFYYSDLAIETALTLRLVFAQPLRQTTGLVQSIIALLGLRLRTPDFSTLSRRQADLMPALPVRARIQPLHLVVDSTGLKVYGEGEWKVRQHGWTRRRTWRKLHLGVNEATGEIVAQTLTPNSVDDASQAEPLVEQIAAPIEAFGGDGSYDKRKVYQVLAKPPRGSPIEPIIPPQRNAKITQHGNRQQPPLPRDEAIRAIRRRGRRHWKQQSGYHRRSLAETQMFRYKRIIGPRLRARTLAGQQGESRLGCAALNRMTQLGRPQSYKVTRAA